MSMHDTESTPMNLEPVPFPPETKQSLPVSSIQSRERVLGEQVLDHRSAVEVSLIILLRPDTFFPVRDH